MTERILTGRAVEALALAAVRGAGDQGESRENIEAFIAWCEDAILGARLVRCVADGLLAVRWDAQGKEPRFWHPRPGTVPVTEAP